MAQRTVAPQADREQRLTMTYQDFLAWADEDTHAEWVNGAVIVFMPPTIRHQDIIGFLYGLLSQYIRWRNLGRIFVAPCEMRAIHDGPARESDLFFVAREHLDRLDEKRLTGPADLVVEVVSDDSMARDRGEKFYEYEEAGVREYLIVDPRPGRERIDFYRLNTRGKYEPIVPDTDDHYHSTVLPGFWLHADWLWQNPLPDPLALLAIIAPRALRDALSGLPAAEASDRE